MYKRETYCIQVITILLVLGIVIFNGFSYLYRPDRDNTILLYTRNPTAPPTNTPTTEPSMSPTASASPTNMPSMFPTASASPTRTPTARKGSSALYLRELTSVTDSLLEQRLEWTLISEQDDTASLIDDEAVLVDVFLQNHPSWRLEIREEPLSLEDARTEGWRLRRQPEVDGRLFTKLHEIQNGADQTCNASNSLVKYYYGSGFGSTVHIVTLTLRQLLYKGSDAVFYFVPFGFERWALADTPNCTDYSYNWSCYFIPWSNCIFPYGNTNWSLVPPERFDLYPDNIDKRFDEEKLYYGLRKYIPSPDIGVPPELAGRCATCSDTESGFEFALRRYVTRPRAFMRRATREWIDRIYYENFTTPCATLHVRRTDITFYNEGRWYLDVADYMREALPYLKKLEIRTILLLTDSHTAITEALTQYPSFNWVYLERSRWRDNKKLAHNSSVELGEAGTSTHLPSGDGLAEMLAIMVELELARHSSLWIGGTMSNYGDLVYMYSCLKPNSEWRCPPTIRVKNQNNTKRSA